MREINKWLLFCVSVLMFVPQLCLGRNGGPYKGFNLILISINNVGAQHMSLYGYRRKTTPLLDKWAQEALVFNDAYSPLSWTLPAITSVFTSLNPYTHNIMDRYHKNLLSPDIKVLPQILQSNNYATAAFTGGLDYSSFFGHMQGFTTVDKNPSFAGFNVTLKQAQKWLSRNSNKKFFLFIQGYDAHSPYVPPPELRGVFSRHEDRKITVEPGLTYFRDRDFPNSQGKFLAYRIKLKDPLAYVDQNDAGGKDIMPPQVALTQDDIDYLRDSYDETILSVDSLVGKFLDSLDKNTLKKTIVIVFSEHGDVFNKHGRLSRLGTLRGSLYDEVVHVPLIIKLPGKKSAKISGLVQLIDVMPTIMEMLDIPSPCRVQGHSLVPLINSKQEVNDYVYSGAAFNFINDRNRRIFEPSINESIRNHDWKLIHEITFSEDLKSKQETYELYDLKNDPGETKDVFKKHRKKAKELAGLLDKWSRGCRLFKSSGASTREIPKHMIEEARRHGYW